MNKRRAVWQTGSWRPWSPGTKPEATIAAGWRRECEIAKKGVEGCWLELYVDKSDDAVTELAQKYAALEHEAKGSLPGGKRP